MIFYVLRALFVLLMAAVGWSYFTRPPLLGTGTSLWIVCAVAVGVVFVAIDVFSPRKKLAILSGAFFGLLHAGNEGATPLSVFNTIGFGIVFGYAVLRSHDLWLPIGLHFGWNLTLPFLGADLSGITIRVTRYELVWKSGAVWSGGAYGPEASLLSLFVLPVLAAMIWKAPVRRGWAWLLAQFPPGRQVAVTRVWAPGTPRATVRMHKSSETGWKRPQTAAEHATAEPPERLFDGIRFQHVSFRYPGTDRLVLDDVDVHLPAGSVVAVVGVLCVHRSIRTARGLTRADRRAAEKVSEGMTIR